MLDVNSYGGIFQPGGRQNAEAILAGGLKNNINSSDFRELYSDALSAEQGRAMAGMARMVMLNSTLSLASPDGASPHPALNSSALSNMLMAAVQNAPQSVARAANFSAQATPSASAQNSTAQASAAPENPKTTYEELIQTAAQRHNLDPSLVKAVVTAESDFNSQAVSRAGAMGLMQLMPGTAKELGVEDPFDPAQNLEGGSKYLSAMLERFDGDLDRALAAYNWGPGNVAKSSAYPAETRNYLKKVAAYRDMYEGGFAAAA